MGESTYEDNSHCQNIFARKLVLHLSILNEPISTNINDLYSDCTKQEKCTTEDDSYLLYEVLLLEVQCHIWDKSEETWAPRACEVRNFHFQK